MPNIMERGYSVLLHIHDLLGTMLNNIKKKATLRFLMGNGANSKGHDYQEMITKFPILPIKYIKKVA